MGKKADLQARADELGVDYVQKDTIAVLEEKIAAAEIEMAESPRFSPTDDEGRCKDCGRPGGSNHVHTRLGR